METASKEKAIRLSVFSVGAMLIASFASSTHPSLANAQQGKTLTQHQGVQSTQGIQKYDNSNTTNINAIHIFQFLNLVC